MNTKPLSFYQWLRQNYKPYECRIGDLLGDAKADPSFPKRTSKKKTILDYLERNDACYACLETFKDAFKLYQKFTAQEEEISFANANDI